ncbi:hypothetical protein MUP77_09470 [Candidatus Bathyarchaeota archaeon]|nr:hypothetical protein [Candidatus Bathyarchaeota archaeon]
MGKRLDNWLSKTSATETRRAWSIRWTRFAKWITTTENPLTNAPYMACSSEEVDDVIRSDFESLPSHLFQDKYRDILTKYVAYLSVGNRFGNSVLSSISSVRSFFTNEAVSIRLQKGKVPRKEMAMNEHRFNKVELERMWHVADLEGKARLSVAVSLGWAVSDFLDLKANFIRGVLSNTDLEGFASFDARRIKTKARSFGILTPLAVQDLSNYLKEIPEKQQCLWSIGSDIGINHWLKTLYQKAGLKENGSIRFHLIRKYVFDVVYSQCGVDEAKLLVGKEIPLEDATYLQGLEDRLLERYKKFAYPFLKLDGTSQGNGGSKALEEKLEKQGSALDYLQSENLELKARISKVEDVIASVQPLLIHSVAGNEDAAEKLVQNLPDAIKEDMLRLAKEKGTALKGVRYSMEDEHGTWVLDDKGKWILQKKAAEKLAEKT